MRWRRIQHSDTALELTAIERLVRAHPDRRTLAPLERALDDMDAALNERDRDAWVKADERFHRTLIDLCLLEQCRLGSF